MGLAIWLVPNGTPSFVILRRACSLFKASSCADNSDKQAVWVIGPLLLQEITSDAEHLLLSCGLCCLQSCSVCKVWLQQALGNSQILPSGINGQAKDSIGNGHLHPSSEVLQSGASDSHSNIRPQPVMLQGPLLCETDSARVTLT